MPWTRFFFQRNVFFVAVQDKTSVSDGVIIFDHLEFNQGNGFRRHTGKFRAPVTGTYGFNLRTYLGNYEKYLTIGVYKDDVGLFNIIDKKTKQGPYMTSWMLKLQQGEETYLKVSRGSLVVFTAIGLSTDFIGTLLKAD